ncbi:MAG: HEAT repeat domain-containing protein [Roseofilum sp. SID1]|uniref:HEAT repeat domain-containing protein n=1 Tax=Roseofilum sp. SID1 TaxID=2821497 RepID=UPI001B2B9FCD|nr:HEAT repeat domain-containing protein [Roseofilum sp. SID1]MBP0036553.1 HEAT repeat domain-containing protein [Roseofilum sp. SID1]
MALEIATIARVVAPPLFQFAKDKIQRTLNPTELEKALKAGIEAAQEQESKCPLDQRLFYRSAPDGLRGVEAFLQEFFQKEAVLQELKRPFTENGELISIGVLVKEFKPLAEEYKPVNPIEDRIEPWLTAFADKYFTETSNYSRFLVAKEDYLERLAHRFDNIKFGGIAVAGQEIEKSEKLAQIFVMPEVREERKSSLDRELSVEQRAREIENFNFESGSERSRQAELLQEQRYFAQLENRFGQAFLAQKLLNQSQSKKFVLLGAPGLGKSTLMSYFAVMLAQNQPERLELSTEKDWLPILIPIRDLVARQPQVSILEYVRQFAEESLSVHPLPTGFFEHWLLDGRALILLDGLDEVTEESKRYEVVRKIEAFLGQFKHNIAIITSRPAGYKRDFFRTDEFPHYQLQSFDDDKIQEFIDRWYDSRFEDQAEAERRKESLSKALNENDRIKLLAKNPLLLTIIALIHRYQALLPKDRYKLYDKAVETLLTSWDANREISSHKDLKYLDLDDLRRLMERLAYWIHNHGSTGDAEGGTLIDCEELIEQLSREIKTLKAVQLYQAREEAERFVRLIRERTGLLNEQGTDCYAFVHKTFQEYLCAQEIDYQADNEGDFELILDEISNHLHDSHWEEVLLLLIAQQKPKKAAKAITAILDQNSEYEFCLHQDLIFAGRCLAENPKDLQVANRDLAQGILERLVDLEVCQKEQIGDRVSGQVRQTLCSLHETDFQAQTLQLLKDKGEQIDEWRLWAYQIALGDKEAVINLLLKRLQDENEDSQVRCSAIWALIEVGNSSVQVVDILLELLLQDKDSDVRSSAADFLGNLRDSSGKVVDALLESLERDNSWVRCSAIDALGNLEDSSGKVVNTLLESLKHDDSEVRRSAIDALVNLGDLSKEVVNAILRQLKDNDSGVRKSAVDTLDMLNFGEISGEVVNALLKCLQDEDFEVRYSAINVLSNLEDISKVVNVLLRQLKHDDSWVRESAVDALGCLGDSSEEVVNALLKCLHDPDSDSELRKSTVDALLHLRDSSQKVVNAFLKCLQDPDSNVRKSAVNALGWLRNSSEEVVNALLGQLEDDDSNSEVRKYAVFALVKLGNSSEKVVNAFLGLLPDKDFRMHPFDVDTLVKLGNSSEKVVNALLGLLQDKDSWMCHYAVDALIKLGNSSEKVVNALLRLLQNEDSWVRSSAADALGKLGKKSSDLIPRLVQWIRQNQDSKYVGRGIDVLWDLVAEG